MSRSGRRSCPAIRPTRRAATGIRFIQTGAERVESGADVGCGHRDPALWRVGISRPGLGDTLRTLGQPARPLDTAVGLLAQSLRAEPRPYYGPRSSGSGPDGGEAWQGEEQAPPPGPPQPPPSAVPAPATAGPVAPAAALRPPAHCQPRRRPGRSCREEWRFDGPLSLRERARVRADNRD